MTHPQTDEHRSELLIPLNQGSREIEECLDDERGRRGSFSQPVEDSSSGAVCSNRVLGYISITLLVIAWIAQGELAQVLQTKMSYNKPYAIVYVNHGFMFVMLPGQMIYFYLFQNTDSQRSGFPIGRRYWRHLEATYELSIWRAMRVSLYLSIVYLLGDYVYYVALPHTSVGASTCIFNTSAAFTYAFSVLLLKEPLKTISAAGVLFALLGAGITAVFPGTDNEDHRNSSSGSGVGALMADTHHHHHYSHFYSRELDLMGLEGQQQPNVWLADLLMVIAAASYGLYEVCYKRWQPQPHVEVVNTVAGMMGFVTTVSFWIVIPMLNALPTHNSSNVLVRWCSEQFELPSARDLEYIFLNAILALAFNIFLLMGLAFSSPLLVSTGCMLTIPLSRLADWCLYGSSMSPLAYVGSFFVFVGFGALTYEDMKSHNQEKALKEQEESDAITNPAPTII